MSWQDSFVPDNSGWQTSFVPDSAEQGNERLQPSNFMERLGMAYKGDENQQQELTRQGALYSKDLASGALNALDMPNQLLNTAIAIPGAATKFALDQFKSGPQNALVQDLGSEISKNGNAPPLGQQFEKDYNEWSGNQIQPKDNTEKNIGAVLKAAPSGAFGGLPGIAATGTGGFMQQEATNRGWSPDQAALVGLGGAMVGAKAPSVIENIPRAIYDTGAGIGNGVGTMARGAPGIDPESLLKTADTMQSAYTPAMQAAKSVPLTDEATQEFSNHFDKAVDNLDLKDKLHPKTTAVVQEVQDRLAPQIDANGNSVPAAPLNFGELEYFKQRLQQAAQTGEGGADSGVANSLRKSVINFRDNLNPAEDIVGDANALQNVQNANASYRAGNQYEQLADMLKNSDGDITKFQNKLKTALNNTKSEPFKGWSPEDQQTLRDFTNGSMPEKMAGFLSGFGFDLKNLKSPLNYVRLATEGGGSYLAPGFGIPLAGAGTLTRLGLNALKRGQFQGILDNLESRVQPVVQPTPQSLGQIASQLGGNQ